MRDRLLDQIFLNLIVIKRFAVQINNPKERQRILNKLNRIEDLINEDINDFSVDELCAAWDVSMLALCSYMEMMDSPEYQGIFYQD